MNVNSRLTQYTAGSWGSPFDQGIRIAIVAPNAAICASERSTKMTPRSTTWTPRYAWMPAMTRLATNGAARNDRIVMSMKLLRSCLLDRAHHEIDVVVEQLEVVGHLLHAADRRRQHDDLRAGLAPDRVWRLRVEVWLDDDDLHVLPL